MVSKKEMKACALCGYTADGKFEADIWPESGLTFWKCAKCGLLFTAAVPPVDCPQCAVKCNFLNVTCYILECGEPGHVDLRL